MLAAFVLLALAAGEVETVPSAEQLQAAQRVFDELEFDKVPALALPPASWKGLTRAQVVKVLSLRALSLASVKRDTEAAEAFRQLLSLEPGFPLPEQFGPRVRTVMLEQKDAADRAGRLALSVDGATLVLTGTAFGLAKQVSLTWVDAQGRHDVVLPVADRIPVPWDASAKTAWGTVLGPGGSELLAWGSDAAPITLGQVALTPPPPPPVTVDERFSGTAIAGIAVGGVALASLISGAVLLVAADRPSQALALAMRDSQGRIVSPTQRQAFELDAQAQSAWQAGGALLIVGGLAAAASVTLFLVGPIRVSAGPSSVSVLVPLWPDFSMKGRAP